MNKKKKSTCSEWLVDETWSNIQLFTEKQNINNLKRIEDNMSNVTQIINFFLWKDRNPFGEKGKLLVATIFSFSHHVFNSFIKIQGFVEKD